VPGSTQDKPPEAYDDARQWTLDGAILKAGIRGVQSAAGDPPPRIAIHIDKGGSWEVTRWFFDHLNDAKVEYDNHRPELLPAVAPRTLEQLWK